MTLQNNKNALIGRDIEALFKNSIQDNPLVIQKIKEYFNLKGEFEHSILSGIHGEKADVKMGFSCGHLIDVNIKGYKPKSGFNQLTRASVKRFCELFDIPEIDSKKLETLVVSKSKDTSHALFPNTELEYWLPFFNKISLDMVKWGFSHKASREILVLFDRDTLIMRIYPMKDVLHNLPRGITFTKGGFNIGDCISFQRKGGNGSLSKTIPKTSIAHPGNNIQMKIKIAKFIHAMKNFILAEYSIKP